MKKKSPIFIAEIKTHSMFGFTAKYSRSKLTDVALRYGDWISVHTDPRFGGSFDDIYMLRKETKKPILAKGFHCSNDSVKKALDMGADYVLVVDRLCGSLLNFPFTDKILFELSNLINIEKVSYDFIDFGKFVYNGRDLRTGLGKKSISNYSKYRDIFKWVCGASLLKSPKDVQMYYPDCDAFIVGSNLIEFCKNL